MASTGGGACGRARVGVYDARELERRGGEGSVAHCGCRGANGELGEELERAGRRGGSPATEVEDELSASSPGQASARGWVEAKQRTTSELLGTSRQRVDGGGCGGACRRRRLRSAGNGERAREGERATRRVGRMRGGRGGVRGTRRRVRGVGGSRRWPACGRGRRPRASRPPGERRRTTGSSQWTGPSWWARWAAPGKYLFSLSFSVFHLFYYFCNFRALLKMPGHFQKS